MNDVTVHFGRHLPSLVPRPKEEEEKGPGFSRLRMRLIVTPILILNITLSIDL